jgi:hypothetical protein
MKRLSHEKPTVFPEATCRYRIYLQVASWLLSEANHFGELGRDIPIYYPGQQRSMGHIASNTSLVASYEGETCLAEEGTTPTKGRY